MLAFLRREGAEEHFRVSQGSAALPHTIQGSGWCALAASRHNTAFAARYIFDRRGVQTDEVVLRSAAPVLNLEWDKDGEILAVLQKGETFVQLWHLATKNMEARRPAYFPENTRNTTSIAVNHRRHPLKRFD